MDDWDRLEEELLEDPETRAAFEKQRPAFELASKLIELRTILGLTQRELAKRAGMTQPEIARLESGTIEPTWETLNRVLAAVGASVEIRTRNETGKLVRLSLFPNSVKRRRTRKAS